jgi:TRAP-type C4-dicarboxylate transport system permease small subunit
MKVIMSLQNTVGRLNDTVARAEMLVMGAGSFALVLLTLINVSCRYWFFLSTPWVDELSRYLFMWCAFIGMGYVSYKGSHLQIEVIDYILGGTCRNPEKVLGLVKIIASVISVALLIISAVLFGQYMQKIYPSKSSVLGISVYVPLMSTYVGLVLMAFHTICGLILQGRRKKAKGV